MYILRIGNSAWLQASAFYLRMLVFVHEQQISLQKEFDTIDETRPPYLVFFDQDFPIATARYQLVDARTIQPDRLCVHPNYRKHTLGSQLLKEIETIGKAEKCLRVELSAEVSAESFYLKNGYTISSSLFLEDGIPCIKMSKKI
ncbi:GNAT family N-acetyltransferase [Vagococcus sp.]|uniref:GNAT family N-acetyltransferase n=1 Tax=Vagococcus sp. TaxID=1933889 RepID=UPI003F9DF66F